MVKWVTVASTEPRRGRDICWAIRRPFFGHDQILWGCPTKCIEAFLLLYILSLTSPWI